MLCLHQTIAIGKDEPAGLGQNLDLAYARELAERGYVTLAPDYPNFGEYKIDVYCSGLRERHHEGDLEQPARRRSALQSRRSRPARIGVIGHSLGGHNAIFTALFRQPDQGGRLVVRLQRFSVLLQGNIAGWSHQGYMPRLRDRFGLDLKRSLSTSPN